MPPVSLRASVAEKVRVSTQRSASTVAVFSGLPASAAIVRARSSTPLADQLGGAIERRGALVLGKVGRLEGLVGGLGGAIDERRVAFGDPTDNGPVVGALYLPPLAGLDPLARGEELVIDRLHPDSRVEQAETRSSRTC